MTALSAIPHASVANIVGSPVENDYFLSLSTYTFPPPFVPPLSARIDLPRSSSSLGLAARSPFDLEFARNGTTLNTTAPDKMASYSLPHSSSLPSLRLRSASDGAPPPPLPPYRAQVYAYGTYMSPQRRGSDDQPNEILRDESDADHDGDHYARQFGLKDILALQPSASTEDVLSMRRKYRRECSTFDDSCRSFYPTKPGYVFPASRSEGPVSASTQRGPSDEMRNMTLDTSCITSSFGLPSASSTSSTTSGSDCNLQSPLSSAFYGFAGRYGHEGVSSDSMTTATDWYASSTEVMDIYSALRWSRSSKSVATSAREISDISVPQLPPIPKMVDLMDGLFSAYSTPEKEAGEEKRMMGDKENYHRLLPSYTTSTSFPHLAQLASPFLHPRPAPSPPFLSRPTAVARTPTISQVNPIPSCFPSVESGGLGGLNALGLVFESRGEDEDGYASPGDRDFQHDPFARSFAHIAGCEQHTPPARAPLYAHSASGSNRETFRGKRSRRHSWRPSKALVHDSFGPRQYIPYTPPGQVRSVPLASVSERSAPYANMGMSRSLSNLHLPLHDAPPRELISKFEHDNDGDDSSLTRTPFNRLGRSLTRTRSGLGALLAKIPQTPKLVSRDLHPESPAPPLPARQMEEAEKSGRSGGRKFGLGLDMLDKRWIRMGLGRRKSSE